MLTVNGIDITFAVTGATVEQQINSGAGSMSFSVTRSEAGKIFNGDEVELSVDGKTLFAGKVFSRSLSKDSAEITAVDSIRALKAVFPVLRVEQPAGGFIKTMLAMAAPELKMGVIEGPDTAVSEKRFERLSLSELIYRTLDEVKDSAGMYVLRDEGGAVCLRSDSSLKTDLVLDGANVLEINFQISAAEGCNYVKLTSNSIENALSASAVVSDADAIEKWGRCCYIAELDEKNPEQLMVSARSLLEKNSGEREKLSVTAVGDVRAMAGNIVFVDIDSAGAFWSRIISAEHSFSGKEYTMRLQLEKM